MLGEYYGLSLELGEGDGTFGSPSRVDDKNLPLTQTGYGDFNGDGNLDVVSFLYVDAGQGSAPTHLSVLFGDGKGNFTRGPGLSSIFADFFYMTVGDFNQDGKLDLVTKSQELSTYLGNGDGTFRHAARYRDGPLNGPGVFSGDFNGDGKLDLVLIEGNGSDPNLTLWLLEGKGDGTFQKPRRIVTVTGTSTCDGGGLVQLSDFNGDGNLDLAFCTSSQIGVMLGNGDGTFQPPHFYTADPVGGRQFSFGVGDINSDGKQDLLVYEYSNTTNPQFVVFLGNGDGTFQVAQTIGVASTPLAELGIPVGDFNNDGRLDFMFMSGLGMDVFIQQ